MTGIGTGSVYCDHKMKRGGFPTECIRKRVLVIKTHKAYKSGKPFDGAILLIRNPMNSIFSQFEYLAAERSLWKHVSKEEFKSKLHGAGH